MAINPYTGQPLATNVSSAFTDALGQSGQAANLGFGSYNTGLGYGGAAGDLYSSMGANYMPSDVSTGQLATTNLSPYMNPYQQDVINATMNELNNQYGIEQQQIDDAAMAQNAFGGDRMYLQKGVLGNKFLQTKANTLAQLNQGNWNNAMQMGQFDIQRALDAALANQGMRANLYGGAASGLGNLASVYGTLGSGMGQFGVQNLGNLANMGFGFGNTIAQNQLTAGALQQAQQQQLIDAIKAQYQGYAAGPTTGLSVLTGSMPNIGQAGTSTSSSNPGIFGTIGAIAGIASLL